MLADVYAAVSAAVLAASVGVQGAAGGVPSLFGEEYRAQNSSPPQYWWRPLHEKGGPPVFGANNDGTQQAQDNPMPRPLFGRLAPVEIHCWGADGSATTDPILPYRNAEQLLQILAQQIHALCTPMSCEFLGGAFEQAPQFTRAGRVYIALFEFKLQVADVPPTIGVPTSMPITPEMSGPVE